MVHMGDDGNIAQAVNGVGHLNHSPICLGRRPKSRDQLSRRLCRPVAKATTRYQGEKVGFCCERCLAKFEADPAKFASKIERSGKAFNELCIFTKKKLNAEKVSTFKKTVAFCSKGCQEKFEKDPDAHITKVK